MQGLCSAWALLRTVQHSACDAYPQHMHIACRSFGKEYEPRQGGIVHAYLSVNVNLESFIIHFDRPLMCGETGSREVGCRFCRP